MQSENLEKWRYYMKDQTSPNMFIDMSFYYMINAALQRRVWTGSMERPLFPNMYVVLVGPPSIGKGFPINTVLNCLRTHKHKVIDPARDRIYAQAAKVAKGMSQVLEEKKGPSNPYIENLFTCAPDTSTFEGIINFHAGAYRLLDFKAQYPEKDKEELDKLLELYKPMLTGGFYIHSSLHFALEEVSSLFRKNLEDVVNYLVKAFDNNDYNYHTKSEGSRDFIVNPCLGFLAGTQPAFIAKSFDDSLISEGFCARVIFVYARDKRFERYDNFSFVDGQIKAKEEIITHLGKLGQLFGQVDFEPAANEYLRYYFEEELPRKKVNYHPKLEYYYGRKNILTKKLAMAIHFADSLEMKVSLEEAESAVSILDELEKPMHLALAFKGLNPSAEIGRQITDWLRKSGNKTKEEIFEQFYNDLRMVDLGEVMDYLLLVKKIKTVKKDGVISYINL